MKDFFEHLRKHVRGDIRDDKLTRHIYSIDASIYEVEPLGVVQPLDHDDLIRTLTIAADYNVPVTARGGATGITGSCLGKGLIIDASRYLNKIIEINIEKEYAIVEPGVVQDRLNEVLSPYGYRLGPDTSTGNRATLGGMLANNSAGARSLYYGRMVDHVIEVDLALAGGGELKCYPLSEGEWEQKSTQSDQEGTIYREIHRILKTYGAAIDKHFPHIPRHVSGYNLDLLKENISSNLETAVSRFNLSTLIAGSEGTLGIATKIKVRIAKKPIHTGLCILNISDMIASLVAVESMLSHQPLSLEMIDDKILNAARGSPAVRHKLQWVQNDPQAVFIAEFQGATPGEVAIKLNDFAVEMKSLGIGYATSILTDPQEMSHVWDVRKAGLGLLLSKRSYSRAIAFIEDISIAPQHLASFMGEFRSYIKSIGKDAGIYGHIGSGCMHIRPYIDLRQKEEIVLMKSMMDHVSSMVLAHGGAMSGEHGDGLVRSWLNEKMFGSEVYRAFCDVKTAFDPRNLMNPGKIVHAPPLTQDLKLSPQSQNISIPTFLDFTKEGGFELAADLCNGNGQCRKMETVMCPSFQASGDEYHTTRARAQSLRGIIHGKLPLDELTGKALYDVMDLCIECKGCQRECPSQVDMAKMKSELLYKYQEKHGYSLRNRIFGHIHHLDKLASPFALMFNTLSSLSLSKSLLGWVGITPERPLPALARKRFSSWFKSQKQKKEIKSVVLFDDTYTEFHEPEIGKAAYKVLTALGYEVVLVNGHCCGRPLISKGLLKQAKAHAETLLEIFSTHVNHGSQIIALEPSCLSAFRDDYYGLLGKSDLLDALSTHCLSFEEFLQQHIKDGSLPIKFSDRKQDVWVHTHCHQKALAGSAPTLDVLRAISGFTVHEIESGCCGMAGSFGYEKEHYTFSMKIGELRLLPAVRKTQDTAIIVASGFSCRSQITHATSRYPLHLAQAIASHMNENNENNENNEHNENE
ncbi:MAG: FAD-linked oxidase C-terminal domain-containing protein [Parachlamydiaceae bacterium]